MVLGFIPVCKNVSKAGIAAVYVHGCSGDFVREKLCEESITATDIINGIPHILPVEKHNRI